MTSPPARSAHPVPNRRATRSLRGRAEPIEKPFLPISANEMKIERRRSSRTFGVWEIDSLDALLRGIHIFDVPNHQMFHIENLKYGKNEVLAAYIEVATGVVRTVQQVSSKVQQLLQKNQVGKTDSYNVHEELLRLTDVLAARKSSRQRKRPIASSWTGPDSKNSATVGIISLDDESGDSPAWPAADIFSTQSSSSTPSSFARLESRFHSWSQTRSPLPFPYYPVRPPPQTLGPDSLPAAPVRLYTTPFMPSPKPWLPQYLRKLEESSDSYLGRWAHF